MKSSLFGFVLLSMALSRSVEAEVQYSLLDLGAIESGNSYATGINDSGQIVGYTDDHSFSYVNGDETNLGTNSLAFSINDNGDIAGYAATSEGDWHAFLYANGNRTDLGTLGGVESRATGINSAEAVVGSSYISGNTAFHAFLYSSGQMIDLGTLGGSTSAASAINSTGEVVGYSDTSNDVSQHAFLYSNSTMTDLGTLGGNYSAALGINDNGDITGYATTLNDAAQDAFIYSNGTMKDIGTLNNGWSVGRAINNYGIVVGDVTMADDVVHAFVYDGSQMVDLNELIAPTTDFTLRNALSINDEGQIVGIASTPTGTHAFLLTPSSESISHAQTSTPEPTSLTLLTLAALPLLKRRRR